MPLTDPIYQAVSGTPRWQVIVDGPAGGPGVLEVTPTPRLPIGTVVHARDVQDGFAALIYLRAPVGLAGGLAVTYKTSGVGLGAVVVPLDDATPAGAPVVVSITPFPQGGYGFFMQSGLARVRIYPEQAAPANTAVYSADSTTPAGQVTNNVRPGFRLAGATFAGGMISGLAEVQVSDMTAKDDA